MKRYLVKPDWRQSAIQVQADSAFFALHAAARKDKDNKLRQYTYGSGMGVQVFDWGTRFERNQVCVDVATL